MEKLLSAKQVSDITGINYKTVLKHIEKGYLPTFRTEPGGKHYITAEAMERYAFDVWDAGIGVRQWNPYDPEGLHARMKIYGVI